jgi:hypothetical protein
MSIALSAHLTPSGKKQHFLRKQEQKSVQKPMERDKKAAVQVERPTIAGGAVE